MITFGTPKHHWNYFLAIERDLENLSRYIEFSDANLGTYSIELTHILLSASSEVDVIMKQLCELIDPTTSTNNIDNYRSVIQANLPGFINEEISIDRYGMTYKPWENWNRIQNPDWWKSHNKVKHQRNTHFNEASLQNTINAVGALLLSVVYYYKFAFANEAGHAISFQETTEQLQPEASLLRINADYYLQYIVGKGV